MISGIRSHQILLALPLLLSFISCNAESDQLSKTDVLRILLDNQDILLSDSNHCLNASAVFGAKTIADYLSSHWIMHLEVKNKNWIDVDINHQDNSSTLAKVIIYSEFIEEENKETWIRKSGNGVQFLINDKNKIIENSLICIGTD